jgi:hypothetical protein
MRIGRSMRIARTESQSLTVIGTLTDRVPADSVLTACGARSTAGALI